MRHNRHRGGQPGNHNARKHGFYSKVPTPAQPDGLPPSTLQAQDLDQACPELVERDVAILRAKACPERSRRITSILANHPQNTRLPITAFSVLARLVRTRDIVVDQRRKASQHPAETTKQFLSRLMLQNDSRSP